MALTDKLETLAESLWNDLVDPRDAYDDEDGTAWLGLGGGAGGLPASEGRLADIRAQCRQLAVENEFAINGHENRVSYIVGAGHVYRAAARDRSLRGGTLERGVQQVLDRFVQTNAWHKRQQEIVRRKDRDGECFIRLFDDADGIARLRFIEPDQVATPPQSSADPAASLGVLAEPHDVETVLGYYVDGHLIPAEAVQHRKAGVDANVKRGLPLFYPVRKNLRRAEKLLRNMSVLAEIQSAIALIRKHSAGNRASVQQFAQSQADHTRARPENARAQHLRRYGPGTILDALAGVEYEFPAAGIDVGRYVAVLQAELRAIASRLVMPEFMLTSDASNANYASTMVAEGPAMKMFQRLQRDMIEDDLDLLARVLSLAAGRGLLPAEALEAIEVRATPPTLAAGDRLREAEADEILVRCGAMTVETMAMRHGLEPPAASKVK